MPRTGWSTIAGIPRNSGDFIRHDTEFITHTDLGLGGGRLTRQVYEGLVALLLSLWLSSDSEHEQYNCRHAKNEIEDRARALRESGFPHETSRTAPDFTFGTKSPTQGWKASEYRVFLLSTMVFIFDGILPDP